MPQHCPFPSLLTPSQVTTKMTELIDTITDATDKCKGLSEQSEAVGLV
jgi:hypothetical protein